MTNGWRKNVNSESVNRAYTARASPPQTETTPKTDDLLPPDRTMIAPVTVIAIAIGKGSETAITNATGTESVLATVTVTVIARKTKNQAKAFPVIEATRSWIVGLKTQLTRESGATVTVIVTTIVIVIVILRNAATAMPPAPQQTRAPLSPTLEEESSLQRGPFSVCQDSPTYRPLATLGPSESNCSHSATSTELYTRSRLTLATGMPLCT